MEDRTPRTRDQILMLALSAAATALVAWMEIPEQQRLWITLTVRVKLQRLAHGAARRAGHLGMGRELRDDLPSAAASYGLAYRLSRLRDRM